MPHSSTAPAAQVLEKKQFVRDIQEKDPVSTSFLVKFCSVGVDKNGKNFMTLVLSDKSGECEARVWDDVSTHSGQVVRDAFVWVDGKCQVYQGRKQIAVKRMRLLREDEVIIEDFLMESKLDADSLYARLLEVVASIEDVDYRAILEAILKDDADVVVRMKKAPAAKSFHHAYPVGLLEHVLSVVGLLEGMCKHYGALLNRDLTLSGGILHDIGKLWELQYERVTDYSTEGKLIGHIVMGCELIDRKIFAIEQQRGVAFDTNKRLLLKHILLSHHGEYEHGAVRRPKCLEALVVHFADNLDSKVNSIHHFIEQDQTPGEWTALHRNHDRYFYKKK